MYGGTCGPASITRSAATNAPFRTFSFGSLELVFGTSKNTYNSTSVFVLFAYLFFIFVVVDRVLLSDVVVLVYHYFALDMLVEEVSFLAKALFGRPPKTGGRVLCPSLIQNRALIFMTWTIPNHAYRPAESTLIYSKSRCVSRSAHVILLENFHSLF